MAIYNNGFPVTYQQYPQYQQPMYTQSTQPQGNQSGGIIWVQGEAGAKAYIVAPNTTAQLWDSDAQVIYLKSADASGMPSLKILDYTIRDTGRQNAPVSVAKDGVQYVTKDEFESVVGQINTLKTQLKEMAKKPKIKVVEEDE